METELAREERSRKTALSAEKIPLKEIILVDTRQRAHDMSRHSLGLSTEEKEKE